MVGDVEITGISCLRKRNSNSLCQSWKALPKAGEYFCKIIKEKISPQVEEVKELCGCLLQWICRGTKSLWRQSVVKGWAEEGSGELKFSNVHLCQRTVLPSPLVHLFDVN